MSYFNIYKLNYVDDNRLFVNDELDIFGWNDPRLLTLRAPLIGNILNLNNLLLDNGRPLPDELKLKLLLRIILFGAIIYTMKIRDIQNPTGTFPEIVLPKDTPDEDKEQYKNILFGGNGSTFLTRFISLNDFFDITNNDLAIRIENKDAQDKPDGKNFNLNNLFNYNNLVHPYLNLRSEGFSPLNRLCVSIQ